MSIETRLPEEMVKGGRFPGSCYIVQGSPSQITKKLGLTKDLDLNKGCPHFSTHKNFVEFGGGGLWLDLSD